MGNGYTRQSIFTSGDVIKAEHGNDEFNQVVAFAAQATGHTHGGGAAEGAYVPLISDPTNTDKVEVVTGGAKTTGTHQITGATTLDSTLAVTGTTTTTDITTTGNIAVTGTVDGRDLSIDGAKLDTITGATATTITDASLLPYTPTGSVAATNAQDAIDEVATEYIAADAAAVVTADAKYMIVATPVLGGQLDGAENTFKDMPAAINVIGSTASTQDLAINTYNVFQIEPTADITITHSGIPATGKVAVWFVELLGAGDHTFTWPAAIIWDGGTEPTWASGTEKSVGQFYTRDGGTTVFGKLLFGSIV